MAGGLLSLCVLAVLSGCLQAQEISEHDLYVTQSWRSDSPAVVVRAQENVLLMEQWLEDTNIPVSQVKCESSSGSELCRLLSTNVAVVRKKGRVLVGVDKESINNNTVASVMEHLFGPEFHLIHDYTAMKEFQDGHPQHMLVYARSYREAAFENYLYFLKALLSVEDRSTHVAVTKQPLALPLSQRPKFSKTAELFIWLVSDGKWCQYSNSSHPFHIVGGIAAFYNRIKTPFKLRYMSDQLTTEYQDKGLFTAYVIHSPANKKLAERVVGEFIGTYCNFFVFLLIEKASRKNKLTKALYLSVGENNIIVVEPPLTDMPPIHLNLLDIEEQDMLTMLAPIQEEYTEQYMANPETGKPVKRRRKVVVTDPRTIGYLAVDAQEDMLVAFCDEKDQQVCGHFENSLQKVADIITTSMYQNQEIGFSVVRCSSLDEVKRYGVDDFPYIAYYNVSDGRWSEVQEYNFQEIIQRALGKPEESEEEMTSRKEGEKQFEEEQRKFLKEDNTPDTKKLREADKKSREYHEDPPRPPQETTPPPEQQPPPDLPPAAPTPSSDNQPDNKEGQTRAIVEEDDHFGQLSFSLGTPEYPEELTLSDETFGVHINSYSTTMVTFYVPWEPHCDGVMHYMLQALDDLPEDSDSSMAVVNCADYPDLCTSYGIVTYPTVLLFRASPNDWIPYKGMMDSRQMLKALLHRQEEDTTEYGLLELTAETLPLLIPRGALSQTVLVVWVGERGGEGGEEVADGRRELSSLAASGELGNYSFAWMDCKDHKELLLKIVPEDFECESLLLIDFQQRSVYQLPPTEWLTHNSLPVAMTDFLSRYTSGALPPTSHLTDWTWPPLQPPIKFPSASRGQRDVGGTSTPSSPLPSPSPPPFPQAEDSSFVSPQQHAHTEL